MREIKFRAWDSETNNWEQLFNITRNGRIVSDENDQLYLDHLQVTQFTGMSDKHGKDIYEGDILANLYDPNLKDLYKRFEVKWEDNGYWMPDDYDTECMWSLGYVVQQGIYGEWEVIGNIYENPDLLSTSQE